MVTHKAEKRNLRERNGGGAISVNTEKREEEGKTKKVQKCTSIKQSRQGEKGLNHINSRIKE